MWWCNTSNRARAWKPTTEVAIWTHFSGIWASSTHLWIYTFVCVNFKTWTCLDLGLEWLLSYLPRALILNNCILLDLSLELRMKLGYILGSNFCFISMNGDWRILLHLNFCIFITWLYLWQLGLLIYVVNLLLPLFLALLLKMIPILGIFLFKNLINMVLVCIHFI